MLTKFVKIKKITKLNKPTKVYDLSIEENQNFFVNKKLVHNCPMPLNADVWDGLRCPFKCQYCFADSFRASLYTSFFDNTKHMGLRYCKPEYFRSEMDKLMKFAGQRNEGTELQRAIGLRIPIRLGIRFEDFLPAEGRRGVSLDFLKYLAEVQYPVMINTKSELIGRDDYVRALADNPSRSAVHMTVISSDNNILRRLEPGAPTFEKRIEAIKNLTDAGIRVVARIEPFMPFINDDEEAVNGWISAVIGAGVQNVTLDTYSWSATAPGIRRQIEMTGYDYERMFLAISDSQWLGSLMLTKFIEILKRNGLSCSTFDFGNVPGNTQTVCCEVGDVFSNFSFGNNVMAIRFICRQGTSPSTWDLFEDYVEENGGWLSDKIRDEVFHSWNLEGNPAFNLDWAQGITPYGIDDLGRKIWIFRKEEDFRLELLEALIK